MNFILRSGSFLNGTVIREASTPLGTPGALLLDNGFACNTLELNWHNNEKGRSCIRPDRYRGWVWKSPKSGRLVIRLEDKHGRSDCLLHSGVWAGDPLDYDGDGVPEITHIHGCTLIGQGFAEVARPDGRSQFGILKSRDTMDRLVESLKNEVGAYDDVMLTYVWRDGCEPEGV